MAYLTLYLVKLRIYGVGMDTSEIVEPQGISPEALPPVEPVRRAMTANAVFSLITGLLLALAPATVGGWLDVEVDNWLRVLGIALIGHFAILALLARRPDPRPWARLNLLMIAPYPLLMILLVATGLVARPLGQVLVLADGVVVGLVAVAHWVALREASTQPGVRSV